MNQGAGSRSRSGGRDRAQTVQDFAVGASVFLLTVSFVFAFVPSLFTPFESDVDAGAPMQADRVSDAILEETSFEERPNLLEESTLASRIGTKSSDQLQNQYSLPSTAQINVTLIRIDGEGGPVTVGGTQIAAGNDFRDRPAASVTRIVAVPAVNACDQDLDPETGSTDDSQGCRLIVRVW